ncbi:hypothetical protein DCO58_09320 [Helicobacter saguini]|uniref:LapA family protein n=1 Tax=Helicobacter saguini TaxID=1548018 RepID=A0A347VP74_9HELI|nr:hypothetical protein [Helicobacter saguini]MWV61483.1 hypothetical protein [Helicobacter saguini]MWV67846.1 hypothetical protein [Helicobacter saguini]MWV70686.1 hypothetical protein [Helicobacter saguini]MWV72590.1 hypothetical protein [Helicobacter saguini]TLD94598.1 hypothetical protein LS64_005420 [Helicobacter saguini]
MKLRYFIGFAIVYIALVTIYAFYVTQDTFTLHNTLWFDFVLTLPLAVWLCLPMVVLLLITWIFMSIGAVVVQFKKMSLNRDVDKIITQIDEQMLGGAGNDRVFSNVRLKELSKILKRFYLLPNLSSNLSNNEKFDNNFAQLKDIEQGGEVPKIKLNAAHPLYRKNLENGVNVDSNKALNVLKTPLDSMNAFSLYQNAQSYEVYSFAWEKIIESKSAKLIEKALNLSPNHLNFANISKIIESNFADSMKLKDELLISALKALNLSEREYLSLAINLAKNLSENNINAVLSFFERLSKEAENSVFAYFYMLLEVGKTSEASELKSHYPKNDYLPISAFLELKEKGYPLLVFFDPLYFRENKEKKSTNTENESSENRI